MTDKSRLRKIKSRAPLVSRNPEPEPAPEPEPVQSIPTLDIGAGQPVRLVSGGQDLGIATVYSTNMAIGAGEATYEVRLVQRVPQIQARWGGIQFDGRHIHSMHHDPNDPITLEQGDSITYTTKATISDQYRSAIKDIYEKGLLTKVDARRFIFGLGEDKP